MTGNTSFEFKILGRFNIALLMGLETLEAMNNYA